MNIVSHRIAELVLLVLAISLSLAACNGDYDITEGCECGPLPGEYPAVFDAQEEEACDATIRVQKLAGLFGDLSAGEDPCRFSINLRLPGGQSERFRLHGCDSRSWHFSIEINAPSLDNTASECMLVWEAGYRIFALHCDGLCSNLHSDVDRKPETSLSEASEIDSSSDDADSQQSADRTEESYEEQELTDEQAEGERIADDGEEEETAEQTSSDRIGDADEGAATDNDSDEEGDAEQHGIGDDDSQGDRGHSLICQPPDPDSDAGLAEWARYFACINSVAEEPDDDCDQIPDPLEDHFAEMYLPFVKISPDDDCPGPYGIIYRLNVHPEDPHRWVIYYVVMFTEDCGDHTGHPGDHETFSVTFDPTLPMGRGFQSLKTAVHVGSFCDNTHECGLCQQHEHGCTPINPDDYFDYYHYTLWSSRDKHAMFPRHNGLMGGRGPNGEELYDMPGRCFDRGGDGRPDINAPLLNAGEPRLGCRLIENLTTQGFINSDHGWEVEWYSEQGECVPLYHDWELPKDEPRRNEQDSRLWQGGLNCKCGYEYDDQDRVIGWLGGKTCRWRDKNPWMDRWVRNQLLGLPSSQWGGFDQGFYEKCLQAGRLYCDALAKKDGTFKGYIYNRCILGEEAICEADASATRRLAGGYCNWGDAP